MMYSLRWTFWYAICMNRSYGCKVMTGQSMQHGLGFLREKSTETKISQIWIACGSRIAVDALFAEVGGGSPDLPRAACPPNPRSGSGSRLGWLSIPETLIIFSCSSHRNFASVAPIHAYSTSKCSSQRVHHFIPLHHFHLSSSWCPKCC